MRMVDECSPSLPAVNARGHLSGQGPTTFWLGKCRNVDGSRTRVQEYARNMQDKKGSVYALSRGAEVTDVQPVGIHALPMRAEHNRARVLFNACMTFAENVLERFHEYADARLNEELTIVEQRRRLLTPQETLPSAAPHGRALAARPAR
jgi:hypothetical protein